MDVGCGMALARLIGAMAILGLVVAISRRFG